MTELDQQFQLYLDLLSEGQTLSLIERLYAPDVCVFENRELSRGGRDTCMAHEREQLAKLSAPPTFKVHGYALNEAAATSFVECTIRFTGPDGRPMRIDEVSVQAWERGLIASERFYYEGVVDEGDEDEA